jgi:hypothetical protein
MENPFKFIWNQFYNLFIWSSGADMEVLEQVPMEKNKFYGIGGTIVFTALMASFAGGYAFNTAFDDPFLSVFFGLFWGALIFNLDRYIVSSFGVGDGRKTISGQEIIEATPRLLMAFILGLVISTPLELKLFEKEINVEIAEIVKEKRNNLANKDSSYVIEKANVKKEIAKLEQDERNAAQGSFRTLEKNETVLLIEKKKGLESELQALINIRSRNAQNLKNCQQNPNNDCASNSSNYIMSSNRAKEKEKEISSIIGNIDDLNKIDNENLKALRNKNQIEIDEKKSRIKVLDGIIDANTSSYDEVSKQYDGFMARMEAFSRLKDRYFSLKIAGFFITVLFIFIEIAPILFKMMTERGPYDDIMDFNKHQVKVRQMLFTSNLNEEINTEVKINSERSAQKLEAELLSNKELLKTIAMAQAEIASVAIEKWKQEQIKKAKNNPGGIIS